METLKDLLDYSTLNDIEQSLNTFVFSAKNHPDVLKLTLALVLLLKYATDVLSVQDMSAYPDIVRKRLEDARDNAKQCLELHQERFKADSDLMHILCLCDDASIKKLSSDISRDLNQCEQIMKQVVDRLQTLPSEQLQTPTSL